MSETPFKNDSIFWIDVEKIKPNPYQPRRDFDKARLADLAESIKMYGVLQPLVVTRNEVTHDEGIVTFYELLAGERRLRASKLAGITQVPVMIRTGQESDRMKLEIAIIENLQREDLNPVDRARAFERLSAEFKFSHAQIARKMGKSREYVTNSLRLLQLPLEMIQALTVGRIAEGHARPLLMLASRKDEQETLFKEIVYRQITVREAEQIARRIAADKARKKLQYQDPETIEMEKNLAESLGTRVQIEKRETGGKIVIDYFSEEDLNNILNIFKATKSKDPNAMLDHYLKEQQDVENAQKAENAQKEKEQNEMIVNAELVDASALESEDVEYVSTKLALGDIQQQGIEFVEIVKDTPNIQTERNAINSRQSESDKTPETQSTDTTDTAYSASDVKNQLNSQHVSVREQVTNNVNDVLETKIQHAEQVAEQINLKDQHEQYDRDGQANVDTLVTKKTLSATIPSSLVGETTTDAEIKQNTKRPTVIEPIDTELRQPEKSSSPDTTEAEEKEDLYSISRFSI